jgi:hypothetical protein
VPCAFARELPNLEGVQQDQQPATCSSDEHGSCGRGVGHARDHGKAGEIRLAFATTGSEACLCAESAGGGIPSSLG